MLQKLNKNRGGFTLVEIMIVVAIIALLAAIAVPNFLRARKRSQATRCLEDLRLIDAADDQYAIENNKMSGAVVAWTDVQNYLVPTIQAAIKIQDKDAAAAIKILERTKPYDFAYPDSFQNLYPAYMRGLAYLQMGEASLARVEFQKLLDHPGLVEMNVIGALSRLQLARAIRLSGDTAAARKAYEDFLTFWKTADADIPIYRQAKAEYAQLSP